MRIAGSLALAGFACAASPPNGAAAAVEVAKPFPVENPGPLIEEARPPPTNERARLETACFASPWHSRNEGLGPKPLSDQTRERLDLLVRDCKDAYPDQGPGRFATPFAIPPPECHYGIGRIYFEYAHYPESARWFLRVADEHADADVSVYGAQLYLESLNVVATHAEPPRPECKQLLGRDAQRFACRWCAKPDTRELCENLRRIAKELASDGDGCEK